MPRPISHFLSVSLCILGASSLSAQEPSPSPEQAEQQEQGWKKLAAPEVFSEESYDREGMRAAAKDAFPVLDHPEMAAAEDAQAIDPDEPVIGLFLGGEARAYPISVMGGVELVNDTCGEVPVAVSW
jgi:hypothetical protein